MGAVHAATRHNGKLVAFMHWAAYWVGQEYVPYAAKVDWQHLLGQRTTDLDAMLAASSSSSPALLGPAGAPGPGLGPAGPGGHWHQWRHDQGWAGLGRAGLPPLRLAPPSPNLRHALALCVLWPASSLALSCFGLVHTLVSLWSYAGGAESVACGCTGLLLPCGVN